MFNINVCTISQDVKEDFELQNLAEDVANEGLGWLDNNYKVKDQLKMAETYYLKSFDAEKKVTDYENKEVKLKRINLTIRSKCPKLLCGCTN